LLHHPLALTATFVAMSAVSGIFFPDQKKFYSLFNEVSVNLKDMSSLLVRFVYEQDQHTRATYIDQMEQLEHKNDMVTHKLNVTLGKNFITPFDREDIHYMALGLDDIADHMWGLVRQAKCYNLTAFTRVSHTVADQHLKLIKILAATIDKLKDKNNLIQLYPPCDEMKKLIYTADDALEKAIASLFKDREKSIEIVKLLDHYELFQDLFERCNSVINTIQSIIVKYG